MNNRWSLLIGLGIVILGGFLVFILVPPPATPLQQATTTPDVNTGATTTPPARLDDLIEVESPLPGYTVGKAALTATGGARGVWYFEASFPVELKNASGTVIAQAPAQAQSDWMTANFVPFSVTLTYPAQPSGSAGTLVLKNDNPSGNPGTQKELDIPVVFQ